MLVYVEELAYKEVALAAGCAGRHRAIPPPPGEAPASSPPSISPPRRPRRGHTRTPRSQPPCPLFLRASIHRQRALRSKPAPTGRRPARRLAPRRAADACPGQLAPCRALPRPKPSRLRLAAAGLAACALAALLVAGPHSGLRPASAAEVRAAILRANTWHFVGWHLRGRPSGALGGLGPPLPVPSTANRSVTRSILDDGVRSTHILPPDPETGAHHGVVLILPSKPQTNPVLADSGANFLVGIGGDADGFGGSATAGAAETFEARTEYLGYPADIKETATLTVDRSTHLPVRYVVRRGGVAASEQSRRWRRPGLPRPGKAPGVHAGGADAGLRRASAARRGVGLDPLLGMSSPMRMTRPPHLSGPVGSVATQGGLTVRAERE